MKKCLLIIFLIYVIVIRSIIAVHIDPNNPPNTNPPKTQPYIFFCNQSILSDDNNHIIDGRVNNYVFKNEEIQQKLLVINKEGSNKIKEVKIQQNNSKNPKEITCDKLNSTISEPLDPTCNLEDFSSIVDSFDPRNMAYYECKIKIDDTHEIKSINFISTNSQGYSSKREEYWFFNPSLQLSIDGNFIEDISESETTIYSQTILVRNDVESGSGVELNLSLFSKDLYEKINNNIKCQDNDNVIFSYFATNGAFSTLQDVRSDIYGYVNISKEDDSIFKINNPNLNFQANSFYPGEETAIILRMNIPKDCQGYIDSYINILAKDIKNHNQKVSEIIPIKIKISPICYSNTDCNTNNPLNYDLCVNPGTFVSYCKHENITCLTDNDCGLTGFIGNEFCSDNDLFKIYQTSQCVNPGTIFSYCEDINESILMVSCGKNKCDDFNLNFCENNNVYYQQTCYNRGCFKSTCFSNNYNNKKFVENCKFGCFDGQCIKDTTPPEVNINFDINKGDIIIKGIENSNKTDITLKENCKKLGIIKTCNREYTISDNSNNRLKIKLTSQNIANIYFYYDINNLKYNNKKEMMIKKDYFNFIIMPGKILEDFNFQNFKGNSKYTKKNDKTVIKVIENKKTNTYTKDGISLIGLSTNNGGINYII
jgi:hypothetical protein